MIIPAQAVSISKWFRSRQRSSALGFSFTGTLVGIAIGTTICAFLLDRLGWQSIFYWVGAANLLYALFWFFFYPDRTLGRQEKLDPEKTEADRVSMVSLLRYRSAWGLALGQFGSLYAYYVFVGWLPSYLVMERGMSILRTGIVGSLPFWMGMIGSIGGGWLGDHLIRRGISPTVARKAVVATGLMSATLLVIAAAYTPQTWLAVALLSLCMGTLKVTTGSAQSMPIDLAPSTSVASLVSLQNFGGNIGGLLSPIVTGYIFASTGSFSGALLTAGGVMTFGAFSYVFIVGRLPEQSSAP
jgi:MFS family permease